MKEALEEARKAAVAMADRCREQSREAAAVFDEVERKTWSDEEIRWCRVVDKCDAALSRATKGGDDAGTS